MFVYMGTWIQNVFYLYISSAPAHVEKVITADSCTAPHHNIAVTPFINQRIGRSVRVTYRVAASGSLGPGVRYVCIMICIA